MALYDQRIEEGEIEADPSLVARLLAMARIRDPQGLSLEAADIAALTASRCGLVSARSSFAAGP